jgi:uncharacterized membrane protein
MTTRNAVLTGLALLAAALVYTLVLYPSLPPRVPIHWNLHGEVDGWGTKPWAPFFGPAVMALLLMLACTRILVQLARYEQTFDWSGGRH